MQIFQVFDNIDHLFDLPDGYLYAGMGCCCEQVRCHSPQYSIGYYQQCPDKVTWPSQMGSPPPLYFNAAKFVFQPLNLTTFSRFSRSQPTAFAEQVSLITIQYQLSYGLCGRLTM
ncbi:hypothetical protein ACOSQ3_018587 [Xanthoceras sorbifolium]